MRRTPLRRDPRPPSAQRLARVARRACIAALFACGAVGSWATASTPAVESPRFQSLWRLVAERDGDLERAAIDWDEARATFGARPVADDEALDRVLEAMVESLGDDHSRYLRAARVAEERERFGDLPCIGYFGGDPFRATARGAPTRSGRTTPPDPLEHAGPVAFGLWPDGIGYLVVADLVRAGTAEGVRDAVNALERRGARGLVLDLRGNPGGRLVTMMRVAGVFTSGWLWRALTRWSLPLPYPAVGAPATDLPLVVVVDADVHSAAEGLAGGLQEAGRARVVGATTAGNVEAVLPFCLRDGAQAWLATGVLAPLRGPTWEGRGVVPDAPDADDALATARRLLADR